MSVRTVKFRPCYRFFTIVNATAEIDLNPEGIRQSAGGPPVTASIPKSPSA